MPIQIKVDDSELRALLKALQAKLGNLTPVMREIGSIVRTSVVKNFEVGGRYSEVGSVKGGSKKWQPLSVSTLFARPARQIVGKRGRFLASFERKLMNRKILFKQGLLLGSINYQAAADSVRIGPHRVYAAIHQFGGRAGRGKKVKIPARPYLVVQDEDLAEMKAAITRHLSIRR